MESAPKLSRVLLSLLTEKNSSREYFKTSSLHRISTISTDRVESVRAREANTRRLESWDTSAVSQAQ